MVVPVKNFRPLIWMALTVLLAASLLLSVGMTNGQESQPVNDLQSLLEDLDQRALETGLIYTIVLNIPLSDEDRFSIGYGYDDIDVSMYSIGIDHMCTRRIAGGAERIICIPYTNVAFVFYTNN